MWSNTAITQSDIRQWLNDFKKLKEMIGRIEDEEVKDAVARRVSDALFMIIFIESQLKVEVEDSVYETARSIQKHNWYGEE